MNLPVAGGKLTEPPSSKFLSINNADTTNLWHSWQKMSLSVNRKCVFLQRKTSWSLSMTQSQCAKYDARSISLSLSLSWSIVDGYVHCLYWLFTYEYFFFLSFLLLLLLFLLLLLLLLLLIFSPNMWWQWPRRRLLVRTPARAKINSIVAFSLSILTVMLFWWFSA